MGVLKKLCHINFSRCFPLILLFKRAWLHFKMKRLNHISIIPKAVRRTCSSISIGNMPFHFRQIVLSIEYFIVYVYYDKVTKQQCVDLPKAANISHQNSDNEFLWHFFAWNSYCSFQSIKSQFKQGLTSILKFSRWFFFLPMALYVTHCRFFFIWIITNRAIWL